MVEFKEFLNLSEASALIKEFEVVDFLVVLMSLLVTIIIFLTAQCFGAMLGISLGLGIVVYIVLSVLARVSIKQDFIMRKLCEKKKWEFREGGN
jgi:hypothetical protein